MLEQPALLLGPWTREERARRRVLRAPATGQVLGSVRAPLPTWLSWFGRQSQEVLETEDNSLVMTLCRPWGLERRVGILFRNVLLDGYGRRVAVAKHQNNHRGSFCDPHEAELATFALQESGLVLTFRPALEGNPFTRMILLGAVLSWG